MTIKQQPESTPASTPEQSIQAPESPIQHQEEPNAEPTLEQELEANESDEGDEFDDMSFEDLLKAFDETGDELLSGNENHKGIKTDEVMAALEDIPAAKKLFGNLRRLATQKSQEAAEAKRQYEAKMRELEERSESLLSSDFQKKLEEILKEPEEGAEPQKLDPFNEESMRSAIQAEAKKIAAEMFQQQLGALQEAKATQEATRAYNEFKAAHPEIETKEYQEPIAALLNKHSSLSLQEAYTIVAAQKQRDELSTAQAELQRLRDAARSAGLRTGGGSRVNNVEVPQDVINGDVNQLYAYLERSRSGQG